MKVSCNEGVASHVGPESCGDDRKVVVEALTGESAGRVLSLENLILPSADAVMTGGRQQLMSRYRKGFPYSAWSETLRTRQSISCGSREIPRLACRRAGPRIEPARGTSAMHGLGRSDGFVVPAKSSNKAVGAPMAAERMEGRRPAKGILVEAKRVRTPCRIHPPIEPLRERRADTPLARDHPRQEPGAGIPLAGIRAGGGGQPPSLPRQVISLF